MVVGRDVINHLNKLAREGDVRPRLEYHRRTSAGRTRFIQLLAHDFKATFTHTNADSEEEREFIRVLASAGAASGREVRLAIDPILGTF